MTIAVVKTKTEQAFAEQAERVLDVLPGVPAVREVRKAAVAKFVELGLPHKRIEEWKYTDLRGALKEALPVIVDDEQVLTRNDVDAALGALVQIDATRLVFVNGFYSVNLSDKPVSQMTVRSLAEILAKSGEDAEDYLPSAAFEDDAIVALNTAYMSDGAVIDIADGAEIKKPVLVVHIRAGEKKRLITARNHIRVGKGARATVVEAYVGARGANDDGQVNATCQTIVSDQAEVTHIKCVLDQGGVTHLANWMTSVGAGASYRGFQFTQGVGLCRNQMFVDFAGEGGRLDLSGAVLARGSEHVDTTLVVDHGVPGCDSRELFKYVLDDRARGIFQGKVIVRQAAQKTDGKQMAQSLLLSEDCEFDSKPELEIYADDVACGHGSTSAEIDKDLMFYLRARGIGEAEARLLLIQAFVGEAVEKVEDGTIQRALMELTESWLLN